MFGFLLAGAVILIITICAAEATWRENISGSKPTNAKKESYNPAVIKEVISLLEKLQEFYKGVKDSSGYVSVIPVDSYGVLYGIGSDKIADRIRIALLFYDRIDEYLLNIIKYTENKTDADLYFKLEKWEGQTYYIATSFSRFEGHYKKFMPLLHKAVVERFPDLNIKFDGSKIDIDHM